MLTIAVTTDSSSESMLTIAVTTDSSSESMLTIAVTTDSSSESITDSSSEHSLRFVFDNCMITLLCSSPYIEGECSIQYGKDPSYQDLNPPIVGPINSSFTLHLLDEKTIYYYKVNNNGFQSMGNFTTGKCEHIDFVA